MNRLTLLLIALVVSTAVLRAQEDDRLISYERIASYSTDDLKAYWTERGVPGILAPITHGVDIYEVIYRTRWVNGSSIQASGVYFVPQAGPGDDISTLVYNHGTVMRKERNGYDYNGESTICKIFATDGYAVLFPDYIGLGKGDSSHLYQHLESEAQAGVDMLKAARVLNPLLGLEVNTDLFITGYSQGGHSTMALHKTLEEEYATVFRVTASSPMSGAYDMANSQAKAMVVEYAQPFYLPYLIYSYDKAYPDTWPGDIDAIWRPPFDTIIPNLFDGHQRISNANAALPAVPMMMVREEIVDDFLHDPDFFFRRLLEENQVYDWTPQAPVQICYCRDDEEVYFENALTAYETMRSNGADRVLLTHVGAHLTHFQCATFALFHSKYFFDSIRDGNPDGSRAMGIRRFVLRLGKFIEKRKNKKRAKRERREERRTTPAEVISVTGED